MLFNINKIELLYNQKENMRLKLSLSWQRFPCCAGRLLPPSCLRAPIFATAVSSIASAAR
jgi:hypothetical protein